MRAAVCVKFGVGSEAFEVGRIMPVPMCKAGWVVIATKAFGLNRSELFTRRGDSPGVVLPRVLGMRWCTALRNKSSGHHGRDGAPVRRKLC